MNAPYENEQECKRLIPEAIQYRNTIKATKAFVPVEIGVEVLVAFLFVVFVYQWNWR